ncbi:hypothetical protein BB14905_06148 [Bacillus sp. B14905]|nr:hypothetical protein BB14905_06148 [Bacillus sp. B14905]
MANEIFHKVHLHLFVYNQVIMPAIRLVFYILLSNGGIKLQKSGIHILLGSIFGMLRIPFQT